MAQHKSGMTGLEIEAAVTENRLGDYPKDVLYLMAADLKADHRIVVWLKKTGKLIKDMSQEEIDAIQTRYRAIYAAADSR